MDKKYEIDMTKDRLFGKIIRFTIPIILSTLFQIFYNIADMIVAGKYIGDESLAAVGSTSSLILLIINLFVGLSQGSTIIISKYFGAKNEEKMRKASHTSVLLSLIGGVVLGLFGYFFSGKLIGLMGTPDNVFDMAHAYVKSYFLGMPVMMLYNFSSSVMRAYGDTKRPLYFLIMSGIFNVFLNVIFIAILKTGVEGVAYATVISQIVAAVLNLRCLCKVENACRISIKELRIDKNEFINILRYGLPAGIQSTLFSLSSVLMQAAINSFGSTVMAAHGAATYVDNVLWSLGNGFASAVTTCCAQNYGAKNKKNIIKGWTICMIGVVLVQIIAGILSIAFAPQIMSLFSEGKETIDAGVYRIKIEIAFYFLAGIMGVSEGGLRGLGYSFTSMLISLIGTCVLRVVWLYTVFAIYPTIGCIYASYPATWLITAIVQSVMFIINYKKLKFEKI